MFSTEIECPTIACSVAPSDEFDGFTRMKMPTQYMEKRFGVGLVAKYFAHPSNTGDVKQFGPSNQHFTERLTWNRVSLLPG